MGVRPGGERQKQEEAENDMGEDCRGIDGKCSGFQRRRKPEGIEFMVGVRYWCLRFRRDERRQMEL